MVTGGHGWSRVAREYFRIPTIFPVTGWSRVVTGGHGSFGRRWSRVVTGGHGWR